MCIQQIFTDNTEAKMSNMVCKTKQKNIFRGGPGFHFFYFACSPKAEHLLFYFFATEEHTHTPFDLI